MMGINKWILPLTIFCVIVLSCEKDGNNSDTSLINNKFGLKYAKLIDKYVRKDIEEIENADNLFQNFTSLPTQNFLLQSELTLMKEFNVNNESGLPKYEKTKAPPFSSFPNLILVYVNGDILFTGVNRDMLQHDILYRSSTDEIIRDESIDKLYEHKNPEKIIINSEWRNLTYNSKTNAYYVDQNKVINYNDFPNFLFGALILAPIKSEISLWKSTLKTIYNNGKVGKDYLFFSFNWNEKKIVKVKVIPFTSEYLRFSSGIGETDSLDRVYLRFWANNERQYKNMTHGHVMIYDIVNDTMYNIRHPFFDEKNEGEEFLETQYILGEDENIYYQLVTDKAYYIYKIEPLWDEPMEETDYNPVFFEFYPELKAEWDKLQEQTD